jgi:hypothetical protein
LLDDLVDLVISRLDLAVDFRSSLSGITMSLPNVPASEAHTVQPPVRIPVPSWSFVVGVFKSDAKKLPGAKAKKAAKKRADGKSKRDNQAKG